MVPVPASSCNAATRARRSLPSSVRTPRREVPQSAAAGEDGGWPASIRPGPKGANLLEGGSTGDQRADRAEKVVEAEVGSAAEGLEPRHRAVLRSQVAVEAGRRIDHDRAALGRPGCACHGYPQGYKIRCPQRAGDQACRSMTQCRKRS